MRVCEYPFRFVFLLVFFCIAILWHAYLSLSAINRVCSIITKEVVKMFILLTSHGSVLPTIYQFSHQIASAFVVEKCVCCQDGMDPPQVKEVWLLRCVGSAYYLHIFNESSYRGSEGTGIFDTANYSSHLIAKAFMSLPFVCVQWEHITSSHVVWFC